MVDQSFCSMLELNHDALLPLKLAKPFKRLNSEKLESLRHYLFNTHILSRKKL